MKDSQTRTLASTAQLEEVKRLVKTAEMDDEAAEAFHDDVAKMTKAKMTKATVSLVINNLRIQLSSATATKHKQEQRKQLYKEVNETELPELKFSAAEVVSILSKIFPPWFHASGMPRNSRKAFRGSAEAKLAPCDRTMCGIYCNRLHKSALLW
jgi:hypothetical protein